MPGRRSEMERTERIVDGPRRLVAPLCVACGSPVYQPDPDRVDGRWEADRGRCRACGCDFREREPMSYARMEGLLEPPSATGERARPPGDQCSWVAALETRLTERWLLTIFLGLVACLVMLELVTG
ncbi:MAG: hypothetical protein VXY94_01285 [Planctomycetota bacterium]|nr:hypothetical protein [Planctomycetota bacterium]